MGWRHTMHWTHRSPATTFGEEVRSMPLTNDVLPREVLRHGAYLGLKASTGTRHAAIPALADRLGLRGEFEARDGHPGETIAYLRGVTASPGSLEDAGLLAADAIVHVASASAATITEFCQEAVRLFAPSPTRVLRGVVKPPSYTGAA